MMLSIPNGKIMGYGERRTLQMFLDSGALVRVVARRDSVEFHHHEETRANTHENAAAIDKAWNKAATDAPAAPEVPAPVAPPAAEEAMPGLQQG